MIKRPLRRFFLCALNPLKIAPQDCTLALWGRKVLNDGDDFTFVIG
jgi:hypothetical protein